MMINKICWCGIFTVTMILSTSFTSSGQQIQDLPYREEIDKTFRLSKDARVEVEIIAGPVEIETSEGDNAEVHIVRAAQTRAELDCYQTVGEQNADSLTIHHEQFTWRDKC